MRFLSHLRPSPGGVILAAILLLSLSGTSLLASPFVMLPTTTVVGPFTLTQVPSIAPNAWSSPSWDQYVANAIYALENGLTTWGSGLSEYNAVTSGFVLPEDLVVSTFESWKAVYPGPHAGEHGTRIHYGLHIVSSGPTFQLAGLWNDMNSTDAINLFNSDRGYGTPFPFQFSAALVGWYYGPDGIKGTWDCVGPDCEAKYSSGQPASNGIHELMYVGVGNAIWADYMPGATEQDRLDAARAYVAEMNVNNRYCLVDPASGQELVCSPVVPEPGTGLLLLAGLGAVAAIRRRKRA